MHPRPVVRGPRLGRALPTLAVLLAAASVAAACGGDGDEAAPDTTAAAGQTVAAPEADPEAEAEQVEANQAALDAAECPVDALDAADGPVSIVFWHAMVAQLGETIEAMAAEYNASQDRVVVQLVNQNSYNENFDKYRTASPGDRPNVVQLEESALQIMIDSGTALPVQACVDASGYDFGDHIPRAVAAFEVGGVLWPMPFNTSNPVLYYDANAFRAAGLDPDAPPQTLDEVRAAAQALVESGAAPGGMAFDSGPSSGLWVFEQLLAKADRPMADNENGRAGLAEQVLFDTPEGVEAFTWFRDLAADGLGTYTGRNDSGDANFLAFLGERPVAMTISSSAAIAAVFAQVPVLAPQIDLRVAPLPSLAVPDPGGVAVGGGALWITADKPDAELAATWDFVSWLNEPEQQATWSLGTGYLPIRLSAAESPEVAASWAEQPAFEVPFRQLVDGNETVASAGVVYGPHTQIREALASALDRILIEGADPAEALSAAAAASNELLADYARRTGRG